MNTTLPNELGHTARVAIRHPLPGDSEEVCALRRASWGFLRPWEPTPPAGVDPCGSDWYSAYLESSRRLEAERLLLCLRAGGTILGAISLNEIVRGSFQSAYLGYWIGEVHARQGFMAEGLGLAVDHAFANLGLHRLEANVRPENEPSLALLRRLGFKREGYSPRYLKIAGEWCDHERWAVLAEDW